MKAKKQKERMLFFATIAFLVMIGIMFNPSINKGLFIGSSVKLSVANEYNTVEKLAPEKPIDILPYFLGLVIIVLAILRKEDIISPKKVEKFFYKLIKTIKRSIRKIKIIAKKIERLPKVELSKIKVWLQRLRHPKKIIYSGKIYSKVSSELIKTRDLFEKPYRNEFTHHFVLLLFIIAVLSMSFFAIITIPYQQSGVNSISIPIKVVSQPIEQLSPQPIEDFWPYLAGLAIVAVVAMIKLKKENSKR
jgi:hypothetical protein